jgi:hypothetical protein
VDFIELPEDKIQWRAFEVLRELFDQLSNHEDFKKKHYTTELGSY